MSQAHRREYFRAYYWRTVERRRASARRARAEARVRQWCEELRIPYTPPERAA